MLSPAKFFSRPKKAGRLPAIAIGLSLLSLACAQSLPAEPASVEQTARWEWEGIGRIVAIGDIHGAYDKLVSLLRGADVVDDGLSWMGGRTHLVMCGDLIHRGPKDREVLDLIIRLQEEAKSAGGRVHAILGNHEALTLIRDLRYVDEKSYADFIPEENRDDRREAWERFWIAHQKRGIGRPEIRAAFDTAHPPGYFGRLREFSPEGRYGRWLLDLLAVVKINGILFVHGGLTKETAALGLEEINRRVQGSLLRFIKSSRLIEPHAGGAGTFEEIFKVVRAILKGTYKGSISKEMIAAARDLAGLLDSPVLSPEGPLWYRGNSLENEQIERRGELIPALEAFGAESIVVGHTPTESGRITSRFNGRVFRADVGMGYGREPFCLVLEGKRAAVFNPATGSLETPVAENPQGQKWSRIGEQLPDAQMEEFLTTAEIKSVKPIRIQDRIFDVLELKGNGLHLRAVFGTADEKPPQGKKEKDVRLRRSIHELAAYRLDRKLRLGFVPAVVKRRIEGRNGILGVWTEAVVDLPWIKEQNMLELILEELEEEVQEAWIFSALIDVEPRLEEAVMVVPEERRIVLSDNVRSFSHSPEIQERFLPYLRGPLRPPLKLALKSLDREELRALLRDCLSDGQIDALILRRDRILEIFGPDGK